MANQQRVPTSDEATSPAGGWITAPMWSKVDETTPNDADYLVGQTYSAPCYQTFSFVAFSVPAGVTVDGLTIYYRAAKIASQAANIRASLKVGGTYYPTTDAGINPSRTPTITTYSKVFTVNPKSGLAWTPDDINGIGTNALQAFGVSSSDLTPNVNVYMVFAQVNYTPAPVTFAGVAAGVGTTAGVVALTRGLGGVLAGSGLAAGGLSLLCTFLGAAAGNGYAAGALSATRPLAGALAGSGEVIGVLTPFRNLAGAAQGSGLVLGDLTVTEGGSPPVTFAGVLTGAGGLLATVTKPSGESPWTSDTIHAVMLNMTFPDQTASLQLKADIDAWLVGKNLWKQVNHQQTGVTNALVVRFTDLANMEALMSYLENRCVTLGVQSGRIAKHWCGHKIGVPCQEIEIDSW